VEDDADEEKEHEEDRVVPKEFGADGGQSKVERRDLEKALEINHEVPCRHTVMAVHCSPPSSTQA
jgi:hypothetical protein